MQESYLVDRTLEDALADGSYAHTFTQAEPPRHYDENQRWAWLLGWRLQEHLERMRAEQ